MIVAVVTDDVVLLAVKLGIVPVPEAPKPILVVLFVHETVALAGTTTGVTAVAA